MTRPSRWRHRFLWLCVFGIAFGYLEASVVVYLRELYYPEGFRFPTVLPETRILVVEVWREAATLVMILSVAVLASRNPWARFGAFAVVFGVWDIVYYLGLWATLGWPEGLLTWDVLFLIPVVWAAPVLAPILVAASLVLSGGLILRRAGGGGGFPVSRREWAGATASFVLLLGSFMASHGVVAGEGNPVRFPWLPFGLGLVLGWAAFLRVFRRGGAAGGPV